MSSVIDRVHADSQANLVAQVEGVEEAVAIANTYLAALRNVLLHSPRSCELQDQSRNGALSLEDAQELASYSLALKVIQKAVVYPGEKS